MSLKKIAFALGSNLGDKEAHFNLALQALKEAGLQNIKLGTAIQSSPVDCPEGSDDFLNSSGTAQTSLTPFQLLDLFQKIELEIGRLPKEKRVRNAPRPIDIDILLYEKLSISTKRLRIPHPRICERDFVLSPLKELIPEQLIPETGLTVSQALQELQC